jgi:tetratricopeptide (TPR) repeat protein
MTQGFSSFARISLAATALAFLGMVAAPGPAFSASQPSTPAPKTAAQPSNPPKCATGLKWDATQKKCVASTSSLSPDQTLYDQGRALALAGKYQDALTVFAKIKNQQDAKVLTMIGYSTRKLGDVAGGMVYYQQALALDPNNLYTHEYLGEGYVQIGNIDEAKVHLAKLASLCGTTCEQYQELAKAITSAPTSN